MSGKKRKVNKFFHIGKDIKTDERLTSRKGFPNTNLDTYNKETGKFHNRKKYGSDGFALKDLSVGHNDHNIEDHAHYYNGNFRSDKRDLTKKERKELNKAKKKRKYWK